MFASKDPEENITLTFDFSALAASIANPEITIEVVSGTDADAQAMLSGAAQVDGNKVLQRVTGGVDGVDYHLRCTGESGADKLVIPETLRVRKR
ncbi:hypothetical protein [Nitrosovibrio sp. Nv6]|uniref:phage fiber-tail adaptor protein n=1 Tax=Nitrosovibrio sp. Nv6 TaxID=1855340 RepID=UPI0008D17E2C|nr:hypothetical protein [Nitrosovibrio sp. Nv6]SEO63963.1 hypothetical protein SAMN05216316_0682 [Nitrosovibrio sp. Nv6]